MVRIEDDCVECGKPCIREACQFYKAKHYYCDECGDEKDPDELLEIDGELVCDECLRQYLVDTKMASEVKYE